MPDYDVVIAGGGPAGASLGTLIARGGLSAVIIDKYTFPRPMPCGGMVSSRCIKMIEAVHGENIIAGVSRATSTGCRMFERHDLIAEVEGIDEDFFVERREMDALLFSEARRAGCDTVEGDGVVGVDRAGGAVQLASGRTIRGAVIAGADGGDSIVRRTTRRWRPERRKAAFGLVADLPFERLRCDAAPDAYHDRPHIHFGIVPWGYAWVFPKGDCVSVGVAGMMTKTRNFRRAFDAFVSELCVDGNPGELRMSGRRLSVADVESPPGRGNILLLGDAAGMVEPITGEGLSFAIESAPLAARAIVDALASGRPEQAGGRYSSGCRKSILRTMRHASLARWLFFPEVCRRRAVRALAHHPELVQDYLDILAGKMTYPQYARRALGYRLGVGRQST